MRTKTAAILAAAVTMGAAATGEAQSAPTCSFDAGTATVTVTVNGLIARVQANAASGQIRLNGVACAAATVNNTDVIQVTGGALADTVILAGRFEPGLTPEAGGSSEIEISFALGAAVDRVAVSLTNGNDHLVFTSGGIDVGNDLDQDISTPGVEELVIEALAGNDRIDARAYTGTPFPGGITAHGGDGDDRLDGGNRNDHLFGEDGNDILYGRAGNDELTGGFGDDDLYGGDGHDSFMAEAVADGSDYMLGGNEVDAVYYDQRIVGVTVTPGDGLANDGEAGENDDIAGSLENIYGGSGPDVLIGTASDNFIISNGGDDQIDGGAGDDTLQGAGGADIVTGGAGVDLILGGGGDDTLDGGDGPDEIYAHSGRDLVIGGAGHDILSGNEGNDTIVNDDGYRDRVTCGDGIDDAEPDPLDLYLDVCEL